MNVIEVSNVSKKFGKFEAVKNVSFTVKEGEVFGLLGPNGAGKSTMLNMLTGLLVPNDGTIKIFGKNVVKDRDVLEQMGIATGGANFHWALRVRDILVFYAMIYGLNKKESEKRIERLVKFFGLKDVLYRKFGYLSTGEKMRLVLAKSLINNPKLLVMDEPTIGLDPNIAIKARKEIARVNREFGTTIILTSHYMNEVEQLADRIAFINKGQIAEMGTIRKLKQGQFSEFVLRIKLKQIRERRTLSDLGFTVRGNTITKKIDYDYDVSRTLAILAKKKVIVVDVETKKPTLEDYFVKILEDDE